MISAKSFHRKVFYNIRAINNNTKVEIGLISEHFTENNAKISLLSIMKIFRNHDKEIRGIQNQH